jgi:tetratricopeptide (TPR) repeat protein
MQRDFIGSGRLDSWKAIASYTGRTVRTVIRWEKQKGLPVHRIPGGRRQAVFAYCQEIDEWLNNGRVPVEGEEEVPAAGANPGDSAFRISTASSAEKARAAALVAQANTLWSSLAPQNLCMLAKIFREVVDLDPSNADAFVGLSFTYLAGGVLGYHTIPFAYISAKEALSRAINLAPEMPEVLTAKAWLDLVLDKDRASARKGFKAAPVLSGLFSPAQIGLAMCHLMAGESQEASSLLRELVRQYPLNGAAMVLCCWCEYLTGAYSKAFVLAEEARTYGFGGPVLDAVESLARIRCLSPDRCIPRIEALVADSLRPQMLRGVLGYALAVSGETERASDILNSISKVASSDLHASAYAVALVLIGLEKNEDAVPWLEQSYQKGSLWSFGFPCDPILARLGSEPTFQEFLRRANYPAPREPLPC